MVVYRQKATSVVIQKGMSRLMSGQSCVGRREGLEVSSELQASPYAGDHQLVKTYLQGVRREEAGLGVDRPPCQQLLQQTEVGGCHLQQAVHTYWSHSHSGVTSP